MPNANATTTATRRAINQGAKIVGKQSQRQQVLKSHQHEDEYNNDFEAEGPNDQVKGSVSLPRISNGTNKSKPQAVKR